MAAYEQMYRLGYQGLRVDALLAETGLTKGAFYHHFPSKQALGHAVIDEVIANFVADVWEKTLLSDEDPIRAILKATHKAGKELGADKIKYGCPLNNLAQEMSPVDETFRVRLDALFARWVAALSGALERGKAGGYIQQNVHSDSAAAYIVASIEGCISLAKNKQDFSMFQLCLMQLNVYLETLRLEG